MAKRAALALTCSVLPVLLVACAGFTPPPAPPVTSSGGPVVRESAPLLDGSELTDVPPAPVAEVAPPPPAAPAPELPPADAKRVAALLEGCELSEKGPIAKLQCPTFFITSMMYPGRATQAIRIAAKSWPRGTVLRAPRTIRHEGITLAFQAAVIRAQGTRLIAMTAARQLTADESFVTVCAGVDSRRCTTLISAFVRSEAVIGKARERFRSAVKTAAAIVR